jgi:hypothetical protein
MTDRQLSTGDLAARSDGDEPDNSPRTKQPADRITGASATDSHDSGVENVEADASLTRDPTASQRADTGAADTGGGRAGDRGDSLGSPSGQTRKEGAAELRNRSRTAPPE